MHWNEIPYVASPMGPMPLYWRDERGALNVAVKAYFRVCLGESPGPTPEQMTMVCDFVRYFINAPCWLSQKDEDAINDIMQLRKRAESLASVESVRRWTEEAMEIGIDPW